jgi:hypothetical protein
MSFQPKIIALFLILTFSLNFFSISAYAQTNDAVFEKIQMVTANGKNIDEQNVRIRFLSDELRIESPKSGKILKTFKYSEIKDAEYSYSKNPRWKTGLGLGAASILLPPLLLVAIPIGFTKHRRHWLTFRSETDFAVLRLAKSNRKLVIPTFETKTGVDVLAKGDDK